MILFILQNAYRSDKYNFRNREEWHRDLMRSQTGRRLKEMIPDNIEFRVINASNKIGDHPDSCYKPNTKYISRWVRKINPKIICACGKVAQQGCRTLGLEFVEAPHPAWRALSKEITGQIKQKLSNGIR